MRRPTMRRSTRRAPSWPSALLQTGDDVTSIRALAARARAACAQRLVDCAKARAYAANILSQLAAERG